MWLRYIVVTERLAKAKALQSSSDDNSRQDEGGCPTEHTANTGPEDWADTTDLVEVEEHSPPSDGDEQEWSTQRSGVYCLLQNVEVLQ